MAKDLRKKAVIKVFNGDMKGENFEALYNPEQYSLDKSNSYQSTNLPGMAAPVTQFEPRSKRASYAQLGRQKSSLNIRKLISG